MPVCLSVCPGVRAVGGWGGGRVATRAEFAGWCCRANPLRASIRSFAVLGAGVSVKLGWTKSDLLVGQGRPSGGMSTSIRHTDTVECSRLRANRRRLAANRRRLPPNRCRLHAVQNPCR